jgi:methyl-accepting chemotaxis protein/iron only hydrogenase large subunit-like protein
MGEIIYIKEENCVGCNKCIGGCPVNQANIAYLKDGQNKVRIDADRCINCGHCLDVCDHDARDYYDDTERFFADLRTGTPISVIAAPSIRYNLEDYRNLFGFLKILGVHLIYDVSFGADITTWAYLKALKEYQLDSVIAQPCPAVVSYIQKYAPNLIPKLAPVHSPALCTAVYLRRYVNVTDRLAFLSPCLGKGTEFGDHNTFGIVQYNVTFNKLRDYLEKNHIHLGQYKEHEFDDIGCGLGLTYSRPGGLRENVEYHTNGAVWVKQVEGPGHAYTYLQEYGERIKQQKPLPGIVDILNCLHGCNIGTGTCKKISSDDVDLVMNELKRKKLKEKSKKTLFKDQYILFQQFDKQLVLGDFMRKYRDDSVLLKNVDYSDGEYERVFQQMHKTTEESRKINCAACGFGNCYAFAKSFLNGNNHLDNCINYNRKEVELEKELMEKWMADSRQKVMYLNGIPSPVIAVDKNMNLVFINPAGAKLLGREVECCIGEKCYELFNMDHCKNIGCCTAKAMKEDGVISGDTVVRLAGQEARPVRCTACVVKDDVGAVIGGLEFIIDIAEENMAVATVNSLVQEALSGNISKRGNPELFQIEGFRKTISGINDLLDAIMRPIEELSSVLGRLAQGDLTAQMEYEYQGVYASLKDATTSSMAQVGEMLRDIFNVTVEIKIASNKLIDISTTLAANSQQVSAKTCTVGAASEEISASIGQTVDDIDAISSSIDEIAGATEEMSVESKESVNVAQNTSEQVGEVTAAVEGISASINRVAGSAKDVSGSVERVAEAVKQINTALGQVNQNCEHSAEIAAEAKSSSRETNEIISKLSISSKQIHKIVDIIRSIAEQTNMLALNATIEAAGAGEAGKGFGVVASEVKDLAKRTSEATNQIAKQIEDMQADMGDAVQAVGKITAVIGETIDLTGAIASSVTEQFRTVGGISEAMMNAADQVVFISKEISDIAANSNQASKNALEALGGVDRIVKATSKISAKSEKIAENTEKAAKVMNNIVGVVKEVSSGSREIANSIIEIDMASGETAAKATETSTAANSLAEVADRLGARVDKFKL